MKSTLDDAFQSLATTFFLEHPNIAHEWRTVKSRLSEDRVDLVCAPGAANEVYGFESHPVRGEGVIPLAVHQK
jgi:hypothetical protein